MGNGIEKRVKSPTTFWIQKGKALTAIAIFLVIFILVGRSMKFFDISPGYSRPISTKVVNSKAMLWWVTGLICGSFIGIITAYLSLITQKGLQRRKNWWLLFPGALLLIWSWERLHLGIVSERSLDITSGRLQICYGFSASVASIIMIVTVTLSGFLLARGLFELPIKKRSKLRN